MSVRSVNHTLQLRRQPGSFVQMWLLCKEFESWKCQTLIDVYTFSYAIGPMGTVGFLMEILPIVSKVSKRRSIIFDCCEMGALRRCKGQERGHIYTTLLEVYCQRVKLRKYFYRPFNRW